MAEKTIEQQVADRAKALQDATGALKLPTTADACLIAASNLAAAEIAAGTAEPAKPKK